MTKQKIEDLFLKLINPYLWIFGLGFLLYFPTLFFGFSYFDDNVLILDNINFLQNPANLLNAFRLEVFHILHSSAAYYRPMLTISFMLNAFFAGTTPLLYHLTDVLIHLIVAVLLFKFLIRLEFKKSLAFFFSLIFLAHPVLTQAVSWIPGRNDSLLTLFSLASFIYFINFLKSNTPRNFIIHLVFFFFAVFTKESAIFLPVLFLFYAKFVKKGSLSPLIRLTLGWAGILFIWFILRSLALVNPIKYTLPEAINTIYTSLPATILYLGKIFFPVNLSVLPVLQDSTLIFGFISLILILLVIFLPKPQRKSYLIFGVIWFLIFLIPGFIRPNKALAPDFLEHRVYFPMIGLLILVMENKFIKNYPFHKSVYFIFALILVGVLFVITFFHQFSFKDRVTFWENAASNSPSAPLSHRNLGAMYYLEERFEEAEKEYQKAIEINPNEAMVHNNLGLIYLNKEKYQEAEREFLKELEINPYYDNAHFNLGLLYYKVGDKEKALNLWQKTIEINPNYTSAYQNLAVHYINEKNHEKAKIYLLELQKRGISLK